MAPELDASTSTPKRLARSENVFYEAMLAPGRALQMQVKYQTPFDRRIVPTEKCLFREMDSNALSNGNVGQEHELEPQLQPH